MAKGAKRGLIPFYIPHMGCPHQCVFCNQHRITGQDTGLVLTPAHIRDTILSYRGMTDEGPIANSDERIWEVAFYGGTFTAIPVGYQESLLEAARAAQEAGWIQEIRCSTRPDDLSEVAIARLQRFGVTLVEIGVQSLDPEVLRLAERGHTREDVYEAVRRLRKAGMLYGLQLMIGLPGDTWTRWVDTVVRAAAMAPQVVRLYPVLVIADTDLADAYQMGTYEPWSMEKAEAACAFAKTYMEKRGIQVIRTGLQATEELDAGTSLLAGPYHPAFGEGVVSLQWLLRLRQVLHRLAGIYGKQCQMMIEYPRALTSAVRGHKKRNMECLGKDYAFLHWQENTALQDVVLVTAGRTQVPLPSQLPRACTAKTFDMV